MDFIHFFIENRRSLERRTPACLVYISEADGSFIAEILCIKVLKRQSKHPMNSNKLKQKQMKMKATGSWECSGY